MRSRPKPVSRTFVGSIRAINVILSLAHVEEVAFLFAMFGAVVRAMQPDLAPSIVRCAECARRTRFLVGVGLPISSQLVLGQLSRSVLPPVRRREKRHAATAFVAKA